MSRELGKVGWVRSVVLLCSTTMFVLLLGHFDVCDIVTRALTGDGERTRIQPSRLDPTECDTRFGEGLLSTQTSLAPPPENRKRIVFFGNSQQFTSSLPRGATPDETNLAEIASVLFGRRVEEQFPGRFQVYTASAPNQTFPEALWQAIYWFQVRTDKPAVIVLQASFDTFRKPGIRAGFRTLTDAPDFRDALQRFEAEHPNRAWHDEFDLAKNPKEATEAEELSKRSWLERWIRSELEKLPMFAERKMLKQSFLTGLYSARVLLLGISPTTKRHIAGQTFQANMDAFNDLVDLARGHGATVLIYNAPTNPDVSMFYADEYERYLASLRETAARTGAAFFDLGDAVSSENWGYWIDGPDPIHFNRQGHVELAAHLYGAFASALPVP